MAFHEVRFPDNISRGARGGPERRTQIVELASGDEERNASWANSRRRYDFKDWADYTSCLPSQMPSPTNQKIGTGDGGTAEFQLVKHYASGDQIWTRTITKPVAGSVRIALDGADPSSGWSIDITTGLVTFDTAPGADVAITAGYAFDVPVRFDSDTLDVTLDIERLGSITSIPLLEIRR